MASNGKSGHRLHGSAPDRSPTALLVLDMISDFEFEDGAKVFRAALPVARRIARLAQRARSASIPVVYVNDNLGRWRSDISAIKRRCLRPSSRGAPIVELLAPEPDDYCVLKPKHSGFFATPLATLLEYLGTKRLIFTGVSTHQCILFTATDAYVRDFQIAVPSDCVAARTAIEDRLARRFLRSVLGADMTASSRLKLKAERRKSNG